MPIYAVQAIGHLPGEIFTFGLHVQGASDQTTDVLASWQTALNVLWTHDSGSGNTIQSHISTSVGIDDASAAELDPFTSKQLTKETGAAVHTGSSLEGTLPHSVALAVSLRTPLATRAGRGRFYLPPLAVDTVAAGRCDAPVVTAVANGAAFMCNSMASAGYPVVVYHRNNQTWTDVTRIDVGNVFDDQRRRRNKLVEVRTVVDLA